MGGISVSWTEDLFTAYLVPTNSPPADGEVVAAVRIKGDAADTIWGGGNIAWVLHGREEDSGGRDSGRLS